jgi:hypothetical protein
VQQVGRRRDDARPHVVPGAGLLRLIHGSTITKMR